MQIPGSFDFQIVFAEVTSHLKINYIQIVIVEEAFGLIGANMMLPDKAGDVERCEGEVDNMHVDKEADKEVALMAYSTGPRTRPTGHWHRQLNRFRT